MSVENLTNIKSYINRSKYNSHELEKNIDYCFSIYVKILFHIKYVYEFPCFLNDVHLDHIKSSYSFILIKINPREFSINCGRFREYRRNTFLQFLKML